MGKELKAENLTISVPNVGCDKNCPYCVSKMTGYIKSDIVKMNMNIKKVINISQIAEVTSVLFTGKGEPTLNFEAIEQLSFNFKNLFPLELQTNGVFLSKNLNKVDSLLIQGFDIIAISIDTELQLENYQKLFKKIIDLNMICRLTINITNKLDKEFTFEKTIKYCTENGIQQLTLRRVAIPQKPLDKKVVGWIKENAPLDLYENVMRDVFLIIKEKGNLIRILNQGTKIYDIDGVSFTYSDYCLQEKDNGNNIRSLVFQEDGHLYTSWASKASILF
jgi:sulfatase maturation enzyme AslB (radical SAM superfamily)